MRGKETFEALFNTGDGPADTTRKGRSSQLLARRNMCIADRYYYYGHLTQKRFNIIMKLLSKEFFLSVQTIPDIIDGSMERLAELKQMRPPVSYFARQWPFMKW